MARLVQIARGRSRWTALRAVGVVAGTGALWCAIGAGAQTTTGQVGADQIGLSTQAGQVATDQIALSSPGYPKTGAPGPTAAQIGTPQHHVDEIQQAGARVRGVAAPVQLTSARRTASAPPALSTRREGHDVAVVVVHGRDRCDPVRGTATQQECAAILDYRANQFTRPAAPSTTAEDAVVQTPPASNLALGATAAERLSTAAGADPSVAAEAAVIEGTPNGAQAAAIAATNRDPAVPLGAVAPPTASSTTSTAPSAGTSPR